MTTTKAPKGARAAANAFLDALENLPAERRHEVGRAALVLAKEGVAALKVVRTAKAPKKVTKGKWAAAVTKKRAVKAVSGKRVARRKTTPAPAKTEMNGSAHAQ